MILVADAKQRIFIHTSAPGAYLYTLVHQVHTCKLHTFGLSYIAQTHGVLKLIYHFLTSSTEGVWKISTLALSYFLFRPHTHNQGPLPLPSLLLPDSLSLLPKRKDYSHLLLEFKNDALQIRLLLFTVSPQGI